MLRRGEVEEEEEEEAGTYLYNASSSSSSSSSSLSPPSQPTSDYEEGESRVVPAGGGGGGARGAGHIRTGRSARGIDLVAVIDKDLIEQCSGGALTPAALRTLTHLDLHLRLALPLLCTPRTLVLTLTSECIKHPLHSIRQSRTTYTHSLCLCL